MLEIHATHYNSVHTLLVRPTMGVLTIRQRAQMRRCVDVTQHGFEPYKKCMYVHVCSSCVAYGSQNV